MWHRSSWPVTGLKLMATDLYLREDIAAFLGERDPFATFATMDGEVFRALESRRTYAVLSRTGGSSSSITALPRLGKS